MTSRPQISVRQVIVDAGKTREWRTTSNPRSKYTGQCPLCEHEPRGGGQATYFTITEDDQLFSCHVCGTQGNAFQLQRLLSHGHNITAPDLPEKQTRKTSNGRAKWEGATVKALAQAKGLPADWLHQHLGWKDIIYRGSKTPVIEIPYPDQRNHDPLIRYRVGVSGEGDRYIWKPFDRKKNQRARPYGLWALNQAREMGYVILVEGETDFASLHYSELPALGTPGNSWNKTWNNHLEGLRVYVWQEPDAGGEAFVKSITDALPAVQVITPPRGIKDPNEMFQLLGVERFRERMLGLLELAELQRQEPPAEPAPFDEEHWNHLMAQGEWEDDIADDEPEDYSQQPIGSYFITQKQLRFKGWGEGVRAYSDMKKVQFVASLPEKTQAQADKKRRIKLCGDNYKKMKCRNTGVLTYQKYRCGEPICPYCSVWLVEQFFTRSGRPTKEDLAAGRKEGRSRMDILREHCFDPVIYVAYVGSLKLSADPIQAENQLARQHKRLTAMDTHLSANLSAELDFATNHIRGIRTRMESDVAHYQLVLPGNRENGAKEKLEEHFSRETHLNIKFTEILCSSVEDLKDKMVQLMALRCDWETADQYAMWRAATKGSRMLQGKGVFHKVSGSRPPKQLDLKLAECKVCGACEPIDMGGVYPVATTVVRKVTSEWTGKSYLEVAEEEYLGLAAD